MFSASGKKYIAEVAVYVALKPIEKLKHGSIIPTAAAIGLSAIVLVKFSYETLSH